MDTFKRLESNVRGYCRSFPTVFETSQGATLINEHGQKYIDFFAGAGALNYGHNPPVLKKRLIDYLSNDGVLHSLDMSTTAKRQFLETFDKVILKPRNMEYKVMFPGPNRNKFGRGSTETVTKSDRSAQCDFFTNGFHGMTLGSLALTGNSGKRAGGRRAAQ